MKRAKAISKAHTMEAKEGKPRKQMTEEQKAAAAAKRKATIAAKKAAITTDSVAPKNEIIAEAPKESCSVCLDPYNKAANTKIICPYCAGTACRRCVQTFLTSTTNDPHCLHCNRAWEREFIDDNLTITYRMGDYKKHRENILMERETALLPATQYRAEQIKEADKMEAEMLPPINQRIKELTAKINILQTKINTCYANRHEIQSQAYRLRNGQVKQEKQAAAFIRKCPCEGCRGFLSTQWKCGLCSMWVCPECHEVKGDSKDAEHTCKPENVATAKLLAKDTKGCPGCGEMITKIEGCDQMWCPSCHTAFSWRTGQKETGAIHNPHFYEWQRRTNGGVAPRVAGDMACGGIPAYHELRQSLRSSGLGSDKLNIVLDFHRLLVHIQHVDLPRYHNAFNALDNQDLRIDFLLKKITEEDLKVEVQRRERKREKERAVRRALEVLTQAGTDILRRIMNSQDATEQVKIIQELNGLREYVNELFAKIHERMKLSVPQYDEKWQTYYPFGATAKKVAKIAEAKKNAAATTPAPA
jgi:hypothetical protein